MAIIRHEIKPAILDNIFKKDSKNGGSYFRVSVKEIGETHNIITADGMKPEELVEGVWGTAIVEFESKSNAKYFEYGRENTGTGFFASKLLGFKPDNSQK